MSHELQLIVNVAVAVGIALAGGLMARAARLSPIIGYLLAGVLIGPFTPGFSGDREQIAALAEVGVIFLMFALGIEFSLKELARVKAAAIGGTLLQLALLMGGGFVLGRALGWTSGQSLFFGGAISISSTMVILKTLMDRGETASRHGRLLLAMLIVQDLAVVVLILLLPRLAGSSGAVDPVSLGLLAAKAVAFIGLTLYLGARVVPRLMEHVEGLGSSELSMLTAATLALGTAAISGWLGLSPALGAFMAGLMLTESEFEHSVISRIGPMRDLFATLFFVSVGMLIDLKFIASHAPQVLGLSVFLLLAKSVLTGLALSPFRVGAGTLSFCALGMIPIGEFNYVLAHAGLQSGAITRDVYNLLLAASLGTIVLTPPAFYVAPRFARFLRRTPGGHRLEPRFEAASDELEGLSEHAIVIGYGRVGRRLARGLKRAGFAVAVVEDDLELAREIGESGFVAVYGDASYPNVLAVAHPERARVLAVALPDFGATRAVVHRARQLGAQGLIVARAQRSGDDARLREAGADAVVVPEIAGSFILLEETLNLLGVPHQDIYTGHLVPPPASQSAQQLHATMPVPSPDAVVKSDVTAPVAPAPAPPDHAAGTRYAALADADSSGRIG